MVRKAAIDHSAVAIISNFLRENLLAKRAQTREEHAPTIKKIEDMIPTSARVAIGISSAMGNKVPMRADEKKTKRIMILNVYFLSILIDIPQIKFNRNFR